MRGSEVVGITQKREKMRNAKHRGRNVGAEAV